MNCTFQHFKEGQWAGIGQRNDLEAAWALSLYTNNYILVISQLHVGIICSSSLAILGMVNPNYLSHIENNKSRIYVTSWASTELSIQASSSSFFHNQLNVTSLSQLPSCFLSLYHITLTNCITVLAFCIMLIYKDCKWGIQYLTEWLHNSKLGQYRIV